MFILYPCTNFHLPKSNGSLVFAVMLEAKAIFVRPSCCCCTFYRNIFFYLFRVVQKYKLYYQLRWSRGSVLAFSTQVRGFIQNTRIKF